MAEPHASACPLDCPDACSLRVEVEEVQSRLLPARATTKALAAAHQEQESGLSNYLLGGDATSLESWAAGTARAESARDRLATLFEEDDRGLALLAAAALTLGTVLAVRALMMPYGTMCACGRLVIVTGLSAVDIPEGWARFLRACRHMRNTGDEGVTEHGVGLSLSSTTRIVGETTVADVGARLRGGWALSLSTEGRVGIQRSLSAAAGHEERLLTSATEHMIDGVHLSRELRGTLGARGLDTAVHADPGFLYQLGLLLSRASGDIVVRMRQPLEWTPQGRTQVTFRPDGTAGIEDAAAANRPAWISEKLYPLHSAKVGGVAMKLLMTLSGLALFVLGSFATWSFWFRRWTKRRRGAARPAPQRDFARALR